MGKARIKICYYYYTDSDRQDNINSQINTHIQLYTYKEIDI